MNSGQHGGANNACGGEADPHDAVVDGVVLGAELVCAETGEDAHEGAEADADEHNANSEQQYGTGDAADVQGSQTCQRDEQGEGQGVDTAQLVAEGTGHQTACGVKQAQNGHEQGSHRSAGGGHAQSQALCAGNDHQTEGAAAGEQDQHDVEDGSLQHFQRSLVHSGLCVGALGRHKAHGNKTGGALIHEERADADDDQENAAKDHEGHTGVGQTAEPVCQRGKDDGADAVGCGGHAADHAALVGEELDGVADGAAVDQAHAPAHAQTVADDQVGDVLCQAAGEHTGAEHQAAHKHDPAGTVFVIEQAADDHGDEADSVCGGKNGRKVGVQFLGHGSGQAAPGVHGTDAQIDQTTGNEDQPALFGQADLLVGGNIRHFENSPYM